MLVSNLDLSAPSAGCVRWEVSGGCEAATRHNLSSVICSDLGPGKFANPSKAKQSSLGSHQPVPGERGQAWSLPATAQIEDQSRESEASDWSTGLYLASDWQIQIRPWLRRLCRSHRHQATQLASNTAHHPLSFGIHHDNKLYMCMRIKCDNFYFLIIASVHRSWFIMKFF